MIREGIKMKVENIKNDKGNIVANQFIIYGDDKITFQSYDSEVCYEKNGKLYLKGDVWDYSVTTRRHFKTFINDKTPFTYENKQQWLKEIENNEKIEVA